MRLKKLVSGDRLNVISIHAPARGATIHPSYQPRQGKDISIHAPARGATMMKDGVIGLLMYFNPRTREGCDIRFRPLSVKTLKFQSTHPRGVRQQTGGKNWKAKAFQSTHPRGVRPDKTLNKLACGDISIHAPARGATYTNKRTQAMKDISIHAPARGAT